jgi:hypothetical protein
MRLIRLFVAVAAFVLPFAAPAPAAAQAAPVCSGNLNIVRVSEIKPGMMAKFLEAVAAQQAWYKAAGGPDEITAMRVMDRSGNSMTLSETQVLTMHVEPAKREKAIPHDAGYDAFVAMFKESSTIKSEYITCMVK